MTISVNAAINSHVNQAFANKPTLETLDFVKRLYLTEFEAIKKSADAVLNRTFDKATHSDAYLTLLNYTLEKRSLTETLALFEGSKLAGDDDAVFENNLVLLAQEIASYDNTWWFFKKRDIVSEVRDILEKTVTPVTVETLTNNG